MCHIPDPLNFLAAAASVSRKGLLFWGQVLNTNGLAIAYTPPHPSLSKLSDFPVCFNDNTRLSRGLFQLSLRQLGFNNIVEIGPKDDWITPLHADLTYSLDEEIQRGSKHVALLALR